MIGIQKTVPWRYLWMALFVGILAVSGCARARPEVSPLLSDVTEPSGDICVDDTTGTQMSLDEAIEIAEASACMEDGALLTAEATCNSVTGTWWIGLDAEEPGCMPACVVSVNDRTAETNWRCTGLQEPEGTEGEAPEGGAAEDEAPTTAPIATADATPTDTPEGAPEDAPDVTPSASPSPSAESDEEQEDELSTWAKFSDADYGLTFRYPADWSIELLPERSEGADDLPAAPAVRLSQGSLHILVEYKDPTDDAVIGPGSLPEGTVEQQEPVALLEREVPRHVLVHEGKDKSVFVGDRFPDIELYIQMEDQRDDYAAAIISPEEHALFEQILATFSRTASVSAADPYEGWESFTSGEIAPAYGEGADDDTGITFNFRYPADWSLTERPAGSETGTGPAAAMVELTKEIYRLQIQYKSVGDEAVMITNETPESILMEAGTAWFMNQAVPRFVVVSEETLERVILTYDDDVMVMSAELSKDPALADATEDGISATIRDEADQILASFTYAP